jgi:hypothetical protein
VSLLPPAAVGLGTRPGGLMDALTANGRRYS